MIKVSEFSALNFRGDWKTDFQQNVEYIQKFLPTDVIRIQYTVTEQIIPYLTNHLTGDKTALSPILLSQSNSEYCYQITINNRGIKEDTSFTLSFESSEVLLSCDFCVCMELPGTILLGYTHHENAFDTIFENDFYFRVEGCFLPQEVQFIHDTEIFRDQRYTPKTLSSIPYEQKKLTIGGGMGVPNWVGRKLNHIFSLSEVYVDDVKMVRGDGDMEISVIGNYYPLYVYKILLEDYGK